MQLAIAKPARFCRVTNCIQRFGNEEVFVTSDELTGSK